MCREEIPAQILAGKRLFPNAADGVGAKDGLIGTVFGGGNNEGPLSGIIGDWLRITAVGKWREEKEERFRKLLMAERDRARRLPGG